MAPDLALERLSGLDQGSRVLDPMAGSGVVLRQAMSLGHTAAGFDTDPLAILMARVWTTPIDERSVWNLAKRVLEDARVTDSKAVFLPWMDRDRETAEFSRFWFGDTQRADLRRLAFVLDQYGSGQENVDPATLDVLRLALSRIVVTKEPCASLAQDTSHSRPHRVCLESDYNVVPGYKKAIRLLCRRLSENPPVGTATVAQGDARQLTRIGDGTMDAVLTSPPYLNAIDYLRGHRMALVWLGYDLKTLRRIRSSNIGAERAPRDRNSASQFARIKDAMGQIEQLPRRFQRIVDRYAADLYHMMVEVARVLRTGGEATFVIGNNCIRNTYVQNSDGLVEAAMMVGLKPIHSSERVLPERYRYLPVRPGGSLGKRMRTECVHGFVKKAA